jgi:hypothetical protein
MHCIILHHHHHHHHHHRPHVVLPQVQQTSHGLDINCAGSRDCRRDSR